MTRPALVNPQAPHLEYCIEFRASQHKTEIDLLGQVQRKLWKYSEDWSTSIMETGWESWGHSSWRREGSRKTLEHLLVPKRAMRELERTQSDRTRSNDTFRYWEATLSCEGGKALAQVAQRSCGCSIPGQVGWVPEQPDLVEGGLEFDSSQGYGSKQLLLFLYLSYSREKGRSFVIAWWRKVSEACTQE